ncbi:MAG: polyribonucleotide nucleotidyltransferase [bacterium]|nr:polyribonucleotide nucleotidyltransferase [bacterium]
MKQQEYSIEISGRKLTAIFSDLANQANGAVLVRYGETLVLATAVLGEERAGLDYFPLTVDYEEKFYAAGKILGGRFNKREGKPSDEAVLTGRIVDRTIRPLFASHIRREVQVVITVLSIDEDNDPDVPAVIGASLALATSNIPWAGPVSAVRLGLGSEASKWLINPTYAERVEAPLDLLICGREGKINMIEAEAKEIPEDKIAAAFLQAVTELTKLEGWQKEIVAKEGKEKLAIPAPVLPAEVKTLFTEVMAGKNNWHELKGEWEQIIKEQLPEVNLDLALNYYEEQVDKWLHEEGLKQGRRVDGRKFDEVRPLFAQAGGLSAVVHGTGIFYRGGTHILSTLTLGGPKDALLLEGMEVRGDKRFMHHYNFPPFSTGETGRVGGMNRRAISHGALAEKSLRAVLPTRDKFPYTIRLVSEALASNGSTSMGSVCGSSLALMDGGVPITAPVAGIAIGLLQDEQDENKYEILTDIQGPEDHYGDMDFKVAGTTAGITGLQLDIKIGGIATKILIEALDRARAARYQILTVITAALPAPRATLKPSAPQILTLKIPVAKIGAVIGPGGKMIHKISAETGAEIEIEEDGTVYITGRGEGAALAKTQIESITHEYKAGERFDGEVVKILDFGAFVKISPDTDGLVHISELAPFHINRVTDVVKEGDKIPVVVKEIDDRGRLSLSLKQADPDYATRKGVKPPTPTK